MGKKISVGEMAKLFGVGVQTLHHYEQKGIFMPYSRNQENNYREYIFEQRFQLAMIKYLRLMGCSLSDIKSFLQNRSYEESREMLDHQSQELQRKMENICKINHLIQTKIKFIEEQRAQIVYDKNFVLYEDTRLYMPLGDENNLYSSDLYFYCPTFAFYENDEKHFGSCILPSIARYFTEKECPQNLIKKVDKGNYLTSYYKGSFDNTYEQICKLRTQGVDKKLDKIAIVTDIIGPFVETDPQNYLVKIQIRILD